MSNRTTDFKLDRHADLSVVVFCTIYTRADGPCPHSVCRVWDQDLWISCENSWSSRDPTAHLLQHVKIYRKARESHHVGTGVRGHDLPAVVKLLEVHRGVSDHLLLGTRKIDRPPSKGECEVRLEELDLDATGFDEPHRMMILYTR